ncbi:MAG: flavodoxin family protein [Candidatus Omnitrophica bacterium]|nr:flavodoxin family protein [Candidatus Omnitrophota bacterium]
MSKNILILSGSPKRNGNTKRLVDWFMEGARKKGAECELIETAFMKFKFSGCLSCRVCQKRKEYGCVINDDAKQVLPKIIDASVIVMATPLYFYGPSAQLKVIFDRWFSLYKWDNKAGTMKTPLKGKTMVLLASAYEDIGLKDLARPFKLTADYSGMKFTSLLVPNAGESGDIVKLRGVHGKAVALGKKVCS